MAKVQLSGCLNFSFTAKTHTASEKLKIDFASFLPFTPNTTSSITIHFINSDIMKKFIIASLSILFLCSFSLIGIGERGASPGLIQAIGEAGSPQVFTFEKWEFTEASMAEGEVENIHLAIEINTSSLTCDWKDLQNNIRKKKDYFYVKKFPTATVVIDGATPLEDGRYQTEAMLTLKKKTKPVTLTFSISEEAPYEVKGEGLIIRQDFGFTGGGPKDEVPISFEVTLPADI